MGEIPTDLGDDDKRTRAVTTTLPSNPWTTNGPTSCATFITRLGLSSGTLQRQPSPFEGAPGEQRRGSKWALARPLYTGFLTILPPNGETCLAGNQESGGWPTAGSRHQAEPTF